MKDGEPLLFTIPHLAALAQKDRRFIERKLAGIPSRQKGKAFLYSLENALPALLREAEGADMEKAIQADKRREQTATAELREIELAERRGLLSLRKNVEAFWADHAAKLSVAIRSARWINEEQKKKLFSEILSIKLPEYKEETE